MSSSGALTAEATPAPYNVPAGSPFALTNGQDTGWIDTGALGRSIALQIIANATPNTLTFDQSHDQVQVSSLELVRVETANPQPHAASTTLGAGIVLAGLAICRYVRIRCTAGAGVATFNLALHPTVIPDMHQSVNQSSGTSGALADGTNNPATTPIAAFGMGWTGSTWNRTLVGDQDGAARGVGGQPVAVVYEDDGVNLRRRRVPNTFKTVATAAAGDTALWTPAAGKKFRLMAYKLEVTGEATQAAAGLLTVTLRDNVTATSFVESLYIPAIALNAFGNYDTPWIPLGNGYLSTTANNVLNVNLSAALTAGTCRVLAIGTEE